MPPLPPAEVLEAPAPYCPLPGSGVGWVACWPAMASAVSYSRPSFLLPPSLHLDLVPSGRDICRRGPQPVPVPGAVWSEPAMTWPECAGQASTCRVSGRVRPEAGFFLSLPENGLSLSPSQLEGPAGLSSLLLGLASWETPLSDLSLPQHHY